MLVELIDRDVLDLGLVRLPVEALQVPVDQRAKCQEELADQVRDLTLQLARRHSAQPFTVAEVFTGTPGQQVPRAETVRGFKEILEGKHDEVNEMSFYMKGGIEMVRA